MQAPKTVILGEASEESDTEEVVLSDCESSQNQDAREPLGVTESDCREQAPFQPSHNSGNDSRNKGGLFGTNSILASIGSSGYALARLVNYAPHNLLASTTGLQQQRSTPVTSRNDDKTVQSSAQDSNMNDPYDQMSLFHRSLFTKNRQLQACLIHLYKHPLQAASKGLHTINQRLVGDQRLIQEVVGALIKIKREKKNLDIDINLIA